MAEARDESEALRGTDIYGGILAADTTWDRAGSPYRVHGLVQVPPGVTLTIKPRVRVTAQDSIEEMFLVYGTVRAVGRSSRPVTLDGGGSASIFSNEGAPATAYVKVAQAVVRNGAAFITNPSGYFNLTDSTVSNISATTYLYELGATSHVDRNVFDNSAGWYVYEFSDNDVMFRNNRFVGASRSGAWITNALARGLPTVVHENSFDAGVLSLELTLNASAPGIDATSNYWGTTDPVVIDTMILDGKDDLRRHGIIPYEPFLLEPDPDTP